MWNFQWRNIFGASAFLEAKFTGYTGYYNLDPVDPSPYTYDGLTPASTAAAAAAGFYYDDRSRNQVQVVAHEVRGEVRPALAEVRRRNRAQPCARRQYQPYGPAGFYIYAYSGVPYYRVSYGYDVQGDNKRTSALRAGSVDRGPSDAEPRPAPGSHPRLQPDSERGRLHAGTAWGPRIGAAYDLTGKGTTALRAFCGRYFEGAATGFYTSATPGMEDYARTRRSMANGSWARLKC